MKWLLISFLALNLTACSAYQSTNSNSKANSQDIDLGAPEPLSTPPIDTQELENFALKAELEFQSAAASVDQIIQQLQNLGISKAQCEAALAEVKDRADDIKAQRDEAIAKIDDAINDLDPNDPDQVEIIDLLKDIKTRIMDLDFDQILTDFQAVCDGL